MINLELTDKEAFTLRMVLDRIEGSTVKSRHKYTQEILRKLIWEHDVPYDDAISDEYLKGELMFRWEPSLFENEESQHDR